MKDILLTLDYEMCNGRSSGTVQNCLITPTNELLKVLDKYGFKATFFVDTCFINRLKTQIQTNAELQKEYDAVIDQLTKLSSKGHDLQLHLHPNWYNAIYNDGFWTSIMDDYKISDMPEDVIENMFQDGIELLNSITGKRVVAFRAGAYCLQTYSDFYRTFEKYGIKIDSSVNRHKKAQTEKWEWFDYTKIPTEYTYKFSNDVTRKDDAGSFIEFSIPNYKITFLRSYWNRLKLKTSHLSTSPWGDGKSSVGGELYTGIRKIWVKIIAHFRPIYTCASIDSNGPDYLNDIFRREKSTDNYMLIMGHPKCVTPYSLNGFDKFLKEKEGLYISKVVSEMI